MKGAAVLVLVAAASARADAAAILTSVNMGRLCVPAPGGGRVVDPDELASMVVSEAGALPFLDGSNPEGTKDKAIALVSGPGTEVSEPVYAVLHAGEIRPAEANRPFGPAVDLSKRADARKARDDIVKVMGEQIALFLSKRAVFEGSTLLYKAEPIDQGAGSTTNPASLFGPGRTMLIRCGDEPTPPPTPVADRDVPSSGGRTLSTDVALRLRGTVADLVTKKNLQDVEPATIAFDRDVVGGKSTFGIVGVAGVAVTPSDGRFSLAPYVSYERKRVTGGDGDVEKLAPGLLGAYYLEGPGAALHTKLEISYIDDIEQHARQGKLRLYLNPAFKLGHGRGILFGSYLGTARGLRIRPEFTGLIDVSHVYARGTSEDLKDAKNYAGFGGELDVRAYLAVDSWLKDFTLVVGGRSLFMTGSIEQDAVSRWYGSIEYASEAFPNLGIGLSFTKGENDDTFQKQETYSLGLKLRY